jgi:hypothetical protein
MKTLELPNQGAKKSVENKSSYYGDTNPYLGKGDEQMGSKWGLTLLLKSRIIIIFLNLIKSFCSQVLKCFLRFYFIFK